MTRPEVTRRGTPLRKSADKNCAYKTKSQKNLAGEAAFRFHGTHYTRELDFRQRRAVQSVTIFEIVLVLAVRSLQESKWLAQSCCRRRGFLVGLIERARAHFTNCSQRAKVARR